MKTYITLAAAAASRRTSRIPETAGRCLRQTAHKSSSIKELTHEIRDSLMALDPDITGIWCQFDWDENGEDRLRGIAIDRKSAPVLVRKGGDDAAS